MIEACEVHKAYRGGDGSQLPILRGLSLEVQRGECVAIMGASGAGKSTLLHLIGGLDRPDAGTVRVAGEEVSALQAKDAAAFRNRRVGFVFQFHHLLMDFNALENVMMPLWIRARRTVPCQDAALKLLAQVGLEERREHRPLALSGGEQQRLAIARALACEPPLLLLDEPTGNLDESNSARVQALLLHLNKVRDLTLLLVTHNPQLAAAMDRVFVLREGQLTSSATPLTASSAAAR